MPENPSPPQPVSNSLSGGTWVSGPGFDQTSGTPIDYAEYRQWMTIEYTRNPIYSLLYSISEVRNLSQLSSTEVKNITGHQLHYNITVHNSCTFLSGTYDLSASYQPQKFVLMSEKFDKAGYSYGEVSGPANEYVFGPQGSLITTQPYVRRKPLESSDVQYSYTQIGTTHSMQVSGPPDFRYSVGNEIGQDYSLYTQKHIDIMGGTNYPYARREFNGDIFYQGGGAYNTSSEPGFGDNVAGAQRLIAFIESAGAALGNTTYHQQRFAVPLPINSDNWGNVQAVDKLAVNPYYSTSFHDYTDFYR